MSGSPCAEFGNGGAILASWRFARPTIDNIRGKIADLRRHGFADPVKMITSSPTILDEPIASTFAWRF
jgi:hypothetical protein